MEKKPEIRAESRHPCRGAGKAQDPSEGQPALPSPGGSPRGASERVSRGGRTAHRRLTAAAWGRGPRSCASTRLAFLLLPHEVLSLKAPLGPIRARFPDAAGPCQWRSCPTAWREDGPAGPAVRVQGLQGWVRVTKAGMASPDASHIGAEAKAYRSARGHSESCGCHGLNALQ